MVWGWGSRCRRGRHRRIGYRVSLSPRCRPPGGEPGKRGASPPRAGPLGTMLIPWPPTPEATHLRLLLPLARRDEAGQEQGQKAGCPEQPGHGGLGGRLGLAA